MDIFKYTRLVEARAKAEKCKTNHLVKEMAINVVKHIEVGAVSDYFIEGKHHLEGIRDGS